MPITSLIKKEVPDLTKIKAAKLKIRFDVMTLNAIIGLIYKQTTLKTRKTVNNIKKLFEIVDPETYIHDVELNDRIWLIKTSVYAIITEGFTADTLIIQYCKDQVECDDHIIGIINEIPRFTQLSYEECKYLIKAIDDRLQFGYIVTIKDVFQDLMDSIDICEYKSYKQISEDLYQIANSLINIKRQTNSLDSDQTFSLKEEVFEQIVTDAITRLKDRNKIYITGIQKLNTILSPGYMSKRLYVYLALPGGGKSQLLLKSALDIRKYNHIVPKDPDKTPAVLMIIMENNIDESIERIYNMCVESGDIRNFTPKQIIKKLRNDGGLSFTDTTNTDIIIKYYDNRSISTDDLYTIIKDLYDSGSEVIALVLDYLKRIRPAEKSKDEKEELKNITNELKTLATRLDIPVISAQQLNRAAASVIDAAIQAKKEDITRLIGRDGVGSAWEVIENADWACIINQEKKIDTDELYLTFKLLKRRYRSAEDDEKLRRFDYFNHPYEPGNEIRLMDDINLDKSLSIISLSSQFASANENKRGVRNVIERAKKEQSNEQTNNPDNEYKPFHFDQLLT